MSKIQIPPKKQKDQPGYLDTTGFRESKVNLNQDELDSLDSLYSRLALKGIDKHSKKEFANQILSIMNNNALAKNIISDYSKLLSQFSAFKFNDLLDKIVNDIKDISQNIDDKNYPAFEKWRENEKLLLDYIGSA